MLETGVIFDPDFAFMTGVNRDQGASIFSKYYIICRIIIIALLIFVFLNDLL